MSNQLLGSSSTEIGVTEIIRNFYASHIHLVKTGKNEWAVFNKHGLIDTCRVIRKNRRYRFERIGDN